MKSMNIFGDCSPLSYKAGWMTVECFRRIGVIQIIHWWQNIRQNLLPKANRIKKYVIVFSKKSFDIYLHILVKVKTTPEKEDI